MLGVVALVGLMDGVYFGDDRGEVCRLLWELRGRRIRLPEGGWYWPKLAE